MPFLRLRGGGARRVDLLLDAAKPCRTPGISAMQGPLTMPSIPLTDLRLSADPGSG